MPKVYISGMGGGYGPHQAYGERSTNFDELRDHPERFVMVVFPGGADIQPSLYGHAENRKTFASPFKDRDDVAAFKIAQANNIPCVGICRGGQLLIAMAGGYLYQHTTGHTQGHMATSNDGMNFRVTSCHHQMFGFPLPRRAQLLAWSTVRQSNCYELADGGAPEPPPVEPECVYLPTVNAIATQWHPEWMRENEDGRRFHEYAVERFLKASVERRVRAMR